MELQVVATYRLEYLVPGTVPAARWGLASAALNGRFGDGELRADEHQRRVGVVRLGNCREVEIRDGARAKDETVSRTAELEVPELLTLGDVVAGRHVRVDDARGDI